MLLTIAVLTVDYHVVYIKNLQYILECFEWRLTLSD